MTDVLNLLCDMIRTHGISMRVCGTCIHYFILNVHHQIC